MIYWISSYRTRSHRYEWVGRVETGNLTEITTIKSTLTGIELHSFYTDKA